ncbi:hypothetical protein [Sphingosinicella rhizophila]|uniref:Uncharacterized protein n=1 Tax=Sphingosinicella rhizophila TaxID=3050082 RepID=A0ABU3Q9P7_9SPHN|nr:hypothetical protein [Sphingosinicella sp. GR2756]MDT9600131.1 hypothetical protein [Sphingosinicella sp. GR2756]
MSEHSKIYGEVVDAFETSAAASFGCLAGAWPKTPADPTGDERLALIGFLEELRAAWDLEQSSLYAANRSELQTIASPWRVADPGR